MSFVCFKILAKRPYAGEPQTSLPGPGVVQRAVTVDAVVVLDKVIDSVVVPYTTLVVDTVPENLVVVVETM